MSANNITLVIMTKTMLLNECSENDLILALTFTFLKKCML